MSTELTPKKRERICEEIEDLDCVHISKKLLSEGLNSLHLDGHKVNSEPREIEIDGGMEMEDTPSNNEPSRKDDYDEASENLLSVLTTGTRKFGRRVDYLVDGLIRKSQRTSYSLNHVHDFVDIEDFIPNSIGPHPLTDRPLGKLWPTVVPTLEGAEMIASNSSPNMNQLIVRPQESSSRMEEDGSYSEDSSEDSDEIGDGNTNGTVERRRMELPTPRPSSGCHVAGAVTHSDWGIEEVN